MTSYKDSVIRKTAGLFADNYRDATCDIERINTDTNCLNFLEAICGEPIPAPVDQDRVGQYWTYYLTRTGRKEE